MEPWDKVILYGVFDGMNLSSDGSRDILVTLENGDRVDIPEYFTRKASDFIEKDKLKLKDVIARIKKLDLDSQDVWLNEILNELGSDYGSLKYRAGYEQGRFDSAMEREKVTVPQFVADWIEYCKEHNFTLFGCLDPANGFESLAGETFEGDVRKCIRWCRKESNILARAWLYGHTVEEEPKYTVKIKGKIEENLLVYGWGIKRYFFARTCNDSSKRGEHTRKELEEDGFGWVFDCPGIEIEEVE